MKTEDCVAKWVDSMLRGGIVKTNLKANSCHADGNYFVSYATPVARYVNGKFEVSTAKYSCTTSKLQGFIRRKVPSDLLNEVLEVADEEGRYPFRRRG